MKTSSVQNWYSLGSRAAWLRFVMNTLAVRGTITSLLGQMPYTSVMPHRDWRAKRLSQLFLLVMGVWFLWTGLAGRQVDPADSCGQPWRRRRGPVRPRSTDLLLHRPDGQIAGVQLERLRAKPSSTVTESFSKPGPPSTTGPFHAEGLERGRVARDDDVRAGWSAATAS